MKVVIDIPEDRYADIQRIASVQLERRWPTPEQIIAKGVTINEPRTGKWIRTRTMTHDGELYCDQCEQEHPEQKIIWNFCPNCGCRMESINEGYGEGSRLDAIT